MEIELVKTYKVDAAFLEVSVEPRYWEDASVNGVEDTEGKLIPLRWGANWEPVIDLSTGTIKNWPASTTANIHYKVCDQGEYWLQDANGERIAKWTGSYVPDRLLCVGDNGYGDYIILKVDGAGQIEGWRVPNVGGSDDWEAA